MSTSELSWAGIITAIAILILTPLASIAGGAVGHRYHNRVDRAVRA
jgi:hypothetical protein